ncbi:hypothetical protein Q765_15740 [Flavobacterium rivuli WB 3.3-2 = DSM 21788]|uniref:Uncharacterized protein n=1 Tax=Flavobacterium rivuli WB 3.3-2 = DSM 21788 TaxID=1121895 RepID=A0A0A2MB18_9FLAO|nr:hypothetical protein [Flavobacterium rivuli]KGO85480.1 hypothetical protein Q765_15740 [Flavobacterium rivuli WB 3.3-2 = DSM 21788]
MKNHYILRTLFFLSVFIAISSCGSDDSQDYKQISPVNIDLSTVPYPKLSDYKFFEGEMKDLKPAYKVLPYDLNSSLFTDYAHKKRFVWMPEGAKATYTADNKILEFPTGAVLIKNFYYDNVLPNNTTRIIETRLMIKKADGWIFADYIWNDEQTEAFYSLSGGFTQISWTEGNVTKSANYRIPPESECFTCHKHSTTALPIGPKPQNLNKDYNYANGSANQLTRWVQEGYLTNNVPALITTTADWTDTTKPLELRVRSYLDINCAHCHSDGAHCDYRPMRFAFSETTIPANLGICVAPQEIINTSLPYIVNKRNAVKSVMRFRMNTINETQRMPILGRTVIHTEAVALIDAWINAMDAPCP